MYNFEGTHAYGHMDGTIVSKLSFRENQIPIPVVVTHQTLYNVS